VCVRLSCHSSIHIIFHNSRVDYFGSNDLWFLLVLQ
jgi:hypothetical protein